MTTKRTWAGLLSAALAAAGVAAVTSGCQFLKKGEDEETAAASATAAPEPPPEPEPTATAEEDAATAAEDEVKTYPNQIEASGTYRLKKSFSVYQEADLNSKRLGGVARGTIIHLKATLGQWLLIEWPSGPGELSPGWIHLNIRNTTYAEPLAHYDAGTTVDAGKTVPDAGKTVPDAGRTRPIFKFKPKHNK